MASRADGPVTGRAIANPAIAALEAAAAAHWQAGETAALGGWRLRAAGGFTGRANSALPLGDPGLPPDAAAGQVTRWYAARRLPPMIVVPGPLAGPAGPLDELLAARGWTIRADPALVLTAPAAALAALPGAAQVELAAEPDEDWLALYRYRGQPLPAIARELLLSAPWQAFGSVRRGRATVAVGRVSVAAGWAGITAVEVSPGSRRAGLGTAVTAALAAAAAGRGAARLFLQVAEGNAAARALYARCGLRPAHRYHYRVAPGAAAAAR